ncbi:Molecular chaperone DnaJ [Candidatus Desulfarcum epimagneticum]|uniref:Molecular chaperone DnaJ n=1 Tax=uncultured Desulfobacteraceae bacterium TaxID=218296 RepID=A0A484HG63_9BACT|nr:Molecular chaperone DnaJ [uncultured Desulfobacteraceae bacterium]
MFSGFEKIVEERIRQSLEKGEFDNLPGSGKPLSDEDASIPEDLRMAYKILKNAGCLPPEIELKKKIAETRDLMENMEETGERYRMLKKLNFLIMKLNSMRRSSPDFEMPQAYMEKISEKL